MSALERFEGWMHDFFEGSLAGILGARIQPVDLARRLADHMDDHRLVGAGRTYAPNVFRVFLSPRTLLSFAAFQGDLEEELAAFLAERSRERGLHLVGRVRVSLLGDTGLRPEQLRIDSDVVDRSGDATPSDRTQSITVPPVPASGEPPPAELAVDARRFPLDPMRPVTVGRSLDNDVIVDDATVSRHHARIVPRGHAWMIEDLGSTYGVYVNDRHVSAAVLRPGDVVRFGTFVARIARPETARPG